MLILTNTQIKNIAENLDAGMKCFYNKKTNEVKEVIDFENNEDADKELWQDLIDEIELNFEDYYIFERMTSSESFLVMADFVNKIEEEAIRKRLVWIMNRNHPFRNFKAEIENNGDYIVAIRVVDGLDAAI